MAKTAKRKLLFKPTPISRLSKMTVPFRMVGDPPWNHRASGKAAWESREKAVYAAMMEAKDWPMAWSPDLWLTAQKDNEYIDELTRLKWVDYYAAINDHWHYQCDEAWRENAAIDYHREHFLEPV